MKKLKPDAKVTIREGLSAAKWRSLNKPFEPVMSSYKDLGIEYFKGKSSKFWDGVLLGLILGYIPYLWHMYI